MSREAYIANRIEMIERELEDLRKTMLGGRPLFNGVELTNHAEL